MKRLWPCLIFLSVSAFVVAQDVAKVDSGTVKVEAETPQVRVLRYHYGPHFKGKMHSHPNTVDIALVDGTVRLTMPDGKSIVHKVKPGEVHVNPAGTHYVENLSGHEFYGVLVELKNCPDANRTPPTSSASHQ